MYGLSFTAKKLKHFTKIALACLLTLSSAVGAFAQYKGAPVKKDRLIKALRSKQLQTRDIVTVISSNGVDFRLTAETRQLLIAAGARPEVIRAVADNLRIASNDSNTFAKTRKPNRLKKPLPPDYGDLLDRAMFSYKDQKNPQGAVQFLETAVRLNPKKPEAYQMLGFVNLYGLNNAAAAEKLMREAVTNGGSAVFRVYHDDSGSFNSRCSGSLYISPETIRFESDDNRHTFETSVVNIDKFKLDTESNRGWKNHTVFKVLLKIGKSDMKFRFAPITGKEVESQMVERFVYASKNNVNFPGFAAHR
ncbi:MAG TPA: tetratricopeptide repeat protein [Pyrinomonadaceae bacterium]|jgi:tetratricopeptide (TPR) repeat protein